MEGANTRRGSDEDCVYASQLMSSLTLPMVLNAVVQLNVFEILGKAGPETQLSAAQIVSRMNGVTNPDAAYMLDRMLRLLVGYSVFTCSLSDEEGGVGVLRYGLAPAANYFVTDEDGASLAPLMALLQDRVFVDSWFELKNAVLEGGVPFDRVHGMNAFEYPGKDSRFNEVFNKAMRGQTTLLMKEILDKYKGFEHIIKLVDVGGGLGITLKMIVSKYPTIKGFNFDLPHVIEHAPSHPGVEHVGGNMFESIPEADAIFMKWILHDWSDDHCLKLLKNPENGKVIVVEGVLPVMPEKSTSFIYTSHNDMIMMAQNPGGKERNQNEFLALATGAGFRGINLCCSVCSFWVMEFFK